MEQMKMTVQEIAANMTDGEWVAKDAYSCRYIASFSACDPMIYIGNYRTSAIQDECNALAIASAVNGTYGQNLDPEQYAPIVEALKEVIGILHYDGYIKRAAKLSEILSAAIINPKTTTNESTDE